MALLPKRASKKSSDSRLPDVGRDVPPLGVRPLRLRSRGQRVHLLQRLLHDLGYEPGPVDGRYGLLTFAAVRELQRDLGFPSDGIADRKVLTALVDPSLVHLRRRRVVVEFNPSMGPAAAARFVGRHGKALYGVSVASKAELKESSQADEDEGSKGGRDASPTKVRDGGKSNDGARFGDVPAAVGSREGGLSLWHGVHTRGSGGPGHYEPGLLQRLLHRRSEREHFLPQALRPFGAGDGSSPRHDDGTAVPPDGLFLDLGEIAWGDGGPALKLVRRLRRNVARENASLAVSVPLAVAGDGKGRWLNILDPAAWTAAADAAVLVPPVFVRGPSVGRRPGGPEPRPPSPTEISEAIRPVVERVPSWRCLLLIPLSAIMLDLGPAQTPGNGTSNGGAPGFHEPTVLSYHQALAMAYHSRTRPRWDDVVHRPVFRCFHRGRIVAVWLENRHSIAYKLAIVFRRRLGGVYLSGVGMEDTRIWTVLREHRTEGVGRR